MIFKKFIPWLLIGLPFSSTTVLAQHNVYQKTESGVIIQLANSPECPFLKLDVIADNIVHVLASKTALSNPLSLMRVDSKTEKPNWSIDGQNEFVILKTALLNVQVSTKTGAIFYKDLNGNLLLSNGRKELIPTSYNGEPSYIIKQVFNVKDNESFYGLGQHQNNLMDYRGKQVELLQNNTEVAVPFLVSSNHYGILWDNYSLTKVGDTRDYLPLSALKLMSKEGEVGWLTATYQSKDSASITRPESIIDYSFLEDQAKFPEGYKLGSGAITWEGSFVSPYTGEHNFLTKYGGYLKIWIDGELKADKWRQSWNPATELTTLQLKKGETHKLKIEWNPDGSQSYFAMNWLGPIPVNEKNTFSFLSEAGDAVNYYFVYGRTTDDIIAGYRSLTGKATMLPKWAFGLWQSRERYKTEDEILNTVKEFRTRKIPLDNIVLDWSYWKTDQWGSQQFDKNRFPTPTKMINELHEKYNTHFMISVWGKFYEGIDSYKEFDKNGWLYKRNINVGRLDWIGKGYKNTFYDAFNPEARKGFWDLINKNLYSKGVDAWWMDASEPDIHSNMNVQNRKDAMNPLYLGSSTKYFNAYPLENSRGIYEGQRAANPYKRVFILTRSAYGGQQRYAAVTWSGDIASRWEDFKAQIPAGINFSLSGIPYWTTDIGGFAVEKRYEKPNAKDLEEWRELQTRWYQFGAFCPMFRVHGQFPYREIFNVAPETHPAYKSMLYYNKLRYRLMPYIYSLAGETYQNDYTIMRGLMMDFSMDTLVRHIGDQFMFGPAILVNPVVKYNARERSIYLPRGNGWYNFYDNRLMNGGQTINAEADYGKIPLYIKEGSIIPMGPDIQYTEEKAVNPLTLYVYTGRDGEFSLYEDEGGNYNYEKGFYTYIRFSFNQQKRILTIGKREGSYNGMLKTRNINIVWISNRKATTSKAIKYEGRPLTIKMKD